MVVITPPPWPIHTVVSIYYLSTYSVRNTNPSYLRFALGICSPNIFWCSYNAVWKDF